MNNIHFEQLWELCENLHDKFSHEEYSIIFDELKLKINLYQKVIESTLDPIEMKKAKSRILGEILLSITKLSFNDDINVFAALNDAYYFHDIQANIKKYNTK